MPNDGIRISALPMATAMNDTDLLILDQDNETKKLSAAVLRTLIDNYLTNTTVIASVVEAYLDAHDASGVYY